MKEQTSEDLPCDSDWKEDWLEEDELPRETVVRVEAIKTVARWLMGCKSDNVELAQKVFRLMNGYIINNGDLMKAGTML